MNNQTPFSFDESIDDNNKQLIITCPEPLLVKFLDEGTMLLIAVKPSGKYNQSLLEQVRYETENIRSLSENSILVPVFVCKTEELKNEKISLPKNREDNHQQIKISISNRNRLLKVLQTHCLYKSPATPGVIIESLNSAYQEISTIFEKGRLAKGGTVYASVYFEDTDKVWKPLGILRKQIYAKHKAPFERYLANNEYGLGESLKLHPDWRKHFENLLSDKEHLINDLHLHKNELEEKVNYYHNLFQNLKIYGYRESLYELNERLNKDLQETQGSDSWQSWIYKNRWLFGSHYVDILSKEKIGMDMIPDFLLLTADGFLDVLEIKKPTLPVLIEDKSHSGNHRWSADFSQSIAQVDGYLTEINSNHHLISKRIKDRYNLEIDAIKPRGIILIGQSNNWKNKAREKFRSLSNLHPGIQVITYTDLVKRGENLINFYTGNENEILDSFQHKDAV